MFFKKSKVKKFRKDQNLNLILNYFNQIKRSKEVFHLKNFEANAFALADLEPDDQFKNFLNLLDDFLVKKQEVIIGEFIISWNTKTKFTYPVLVDREGDSAITNDIAKHLSPESAGLVDAIVQIINYKLELGVAILLADNLILAKSDSGKKKLFFNEDFISHI